MTTKFSGILAATILAILLTGVTWMCTGCSGGESTPQSQQPQTQTARESQQNPDMQMREGATPPADGGQHNVMPKGMGFNMTDEDFEELLDKSITEGTVTEEQAAEIKAWWLQRPQSSGEEPDEARMEEIMEWMQQQPESTGMIFGGMGGPGSGSSKGRGEPPQPPQQ